MSRRAIFSELRNIFLGSRHRRQLKQNQRNRATIDCLELRTLLSSIGVTTTADVVDGDTTSITSLQNAPGADGAVSLREAIAAANATAGADTVNVPAGTYTLSLAGSGEDSNATGDLDITDVDGITISGTGARATVINANGLDRVIHIAAASGDVTLEDLTITGGAGALTGGGINSDARTNTLTLQRVTVSGNSATFGGASYTQGNTSFYETTVSHNSGVIGAGVYTLDTRTQYRVELVNSTISNNTASRQYGGALFNNRQTMIITNSTIAGNTDTERSGGVQFGQMAQDSAIHNSIFADNFTNGVPTDCVGPFAVTGSHNIVEASFCTLTGVNNVSADPNLGPLQDNGGPTDTRELLAGSVAIDAGDNVAAAGLTTDQRGAGFARIVNGTVDIGALEFAPPGVSIASTDPDAAEPGDDGQFTVSLPAGVVAPPGGLAIEYTVSGTAANGADYATLSGTVTIPVGQSTALIDVDVIDESVVELSETVTVTLDSTSDAGFGIVGTPDNSATVTIVDNDSAAVAIANATVAEGDVGDARQLVFDVSLDNPVDADVQIGFATQDGTAEDGDGDADYENASGVLTIGTGALSGQIVVNVTEDDRFEADETISVLLTSLDADGRDVSLPLPGNIGQFSQTWTAGGPRSHGVDVGDLDGDGDLDAIVAFNASSGRQVLPYYNTGNGTFTAGPVILPPVSGWQLRQVALGDLDGDGDLDAWVATGDGSDMLLVNDGSGGLSDSGQYYGSAKFNDVQIGDLDRDGDLDVLAGGLTQNRVWLNDGSGQFSSGGSFATAGTGGIDLGDVDGDGDLDAFVAEGFGNHKQSRPNRVWLNNGSGSFTDSGQSLGNSPSIDVQLADFNGDGNLDAFVRNQDFGAGDHPDRVYFGQGNGTFVDSGQALRVSDRHHGISVGDLDGDGDLDVYAVTANAGHYSYLNAGGVQGGTPGEFLFGPGSNFGIGRDVALGDVDGDGDLDAFVAGQGGHGVGVQVQTNQLDSATPTGTITNDDHAPVADADGPYVINEGDGLSLDASASTDADSVTLTYRWDVDGDGDFDENVTGETPAVTSTQMAALGLDDGPAGPITMTVNVSDGTNSDLATTTLTINNVAPSVSVDNATVTVNEGDTATNGISVNDPGDDDVTLSASVGNATSSWSFDTDDGPGEGQTVTITATDSDGDSSDVSFQMIINNVAPTATLSNDGPVDEGGSANVSFSDQLDPSSADTAAGFRYAYDFDNDGTWDTGDGTYSGSVNTTSAAVPAALLGDGPATVEVTGRIIDKDGGFTDYTTTITVNNVAPTLDTLASDHDEPCDAALDGVVTVSGTFSDAALDNDTHTVNVDWGDGSAIEALPAGSVNQPGDSFTGSHTYTYGGIFTVTVAVEDEDGGASSSLTTTAVVAGVGLHGSELQIIGTNDRDRVDVRRRSSSQLRVDAQLSGLSRIRERFDVADVESILIHACDGDDSIRIGGNVDAPSKIDGGAGNDQLRAGRGDDVIIGGEGNDFISAGRGNSWITDLSGNNRIIGGSGVDIVTTGDGNDRISTGRGDDQIDAGNGKNSIYAGAGNDVVTAGSGDDLIRTFGGDDVVDAGDGDNYVLTGQGDDVVTAGSGNDEIDTGDGHDVINAGDGRNRVSAGAGNDLVVTGSDRDRILGQGGHDVILSGGGNDFINAGGGNDIVSGGGGNDRILGGHGRDVLTGGVGRDRIHGGDHDDLLIGGRAANEDDPTSLMQAIDAWVSGDLATALLGLGPITDDGVQDDLNGGSGQDEVISGPGDRMNSGTSGRRGRR